MTHGWIPLPSGFPKGNEEYIKTLALLPYVNEKKVNLLYHMNDPIANFQFLRQCYLFHGISDEDLEYISSFLIFRTYEKDELVYKQEARADAFFLLMTGRVNLVRSAKGRATTQVSLLPGDTFGEAALFPREHFTENAICETRSFIVILPRKVMPGLVNEVPSLQKNLVFLQASHRLGNTIKPKWLTPGEKVIAFTQKHPFLFVSKVIIPLVLSLGVVGGLFYGVIASNNWLPIAFGCLALLLGWIFWQYLDWQNDHYIITNQRVVWIEKVVLLYDSRSEAVFDHILSVGTELSFFGRMFNFGMVTVKTYTGQIKLNYVNNPIFFAGIIELLLQRNKSLGNVIDKEKIQHKLQQKLGAPQKPQGAQSVPSATNLARTQSGVLGDMFTMRSEDGDTITYHKHIFGFLRDAYLYVIGILGIIAVIVFWNQIGYTVPLWFYMVLIGTSVLLFFEVIYRYWDWRNDIYQVTLDQIVDIDKKPLGDEDRRSAPLENVLSTEYKRNGLFGLLFNFGTVYIKVGNEEYTFDDVADPPSVQQDIIQRQIGLKKRKAEKASEAENEKFSEWLKVYHQQNRSETDN